jgi:hypothetical protein
MLIEKSFINWRVLSLVKINTRISETPCRFIKVVPDIALFLLVELKVRQHFLKICFLLQPIIFFFFWLIIGQK